MATAACVLAWIVVELRKLAGDITPSRQPEDVAATANGEKPAPQRKA